MSRSGKLPIFIAMTIICALNGVALADLTTGFTLLPLNFAMQKPYNIPLQQRYSFDARTNTHHMWVYNSDQPFSEGSATGPRTEMRFNPDYTTTSATQMQFEADVMVPAGTSGITIFQIHNGDSQESQYGSTSLLLTVENGNLRHYDDTILASNVYGKWFHLNVIHNTSTHTMSVYVNGTFANSWQDTGGTDWYFKCGVYSASGMSALCQSYYRNVHMWSE
jgi:hypothetical protein